MWRAITAVVVCFWCAACGGGISSYEDGMEAQADIMVEMVNVLEGVTDEASAEAASSEIEELGTRLAEVAAQVKELPQPTMEELEEIGRKQLSRTQEFQKKAASQMMKLAEYEALSDAWTRALANMR